MENEINHAARIVTAGGVVAFPTDTFYGLGCDPFNAQAVDRIFEIKQRPATKAILLLIDALPALSLVTAPLSGVCAHNFQLLRERFWPGPLTVVLPAAARLPDQLVSAARTIGVRLPAYDVARRLATAVGGAITATSANLSGQPNTQTAAEVRAQLGASVDYILDLGPTAGGAPSTLIDVTVDPPALLRAGAISNEQLSGLFPRIS